MQDRGAMDIRGEMFMTVRDLSWVLVLACVAFPIQATAVTTPLIDRDDASRVEPLPIPALLTTAIPKAPKEIEEPAIVYHEERLLITTYGRLVTAPDFLLGLFFDDFQPHMNGAAGLSLSVPVANFEHVVIDVDWTGLGMPEGNWRRKNDKPAQSTFVSSALQLLSLDVTYRRFTWFNEIFAIFYGAGAGVGAIVGSGTVVDVLPNCTEPVGRCAHWNQASVRDLTLPTPVIPVVHLLLGLQMQFSERFLMRLQTGFRNLFYAGLSLGYRM
jgi:hypothetical protein